MWQYGDLFSRQSGYEISFLVRPYYRYQNLKYTPDIRDLINKSNHHVMSLNFSYEKPVKFNWQHSLSAEVSGGIGSSSEENRQTGNDYKNSEKYNTFAAFANYSLGFYPNTRTNVRVTTSHQISKYIYDDERRNTEYYSTLSANLYYYFSPNLRLASDYSLYYLPSRIKGNEGYYYNRNSFSSSFNIRLTYSIF